MCQQMLPKLIYNQSETGNPEKLSLIFFRPSKEIAGHHNLAYAAYLHISISAPNRSVRR